LKLRIHAIEPASRANGPGLRAVIWFQGCSLGCPCCFNPATHDSSGGFDADTAALAANLRRNPHSIEGISISGGEPFQQPEALLDLLKLLSDSGLNTLVFTGYTLAEIRNQPVGPLILPHLDVLIAGRYVKSRHLAHALIGSTNQQIHLLTPRYAPADFEKIPRREIILHADGSITLTGISPYTSSVNQALER
jgi:anaerobic ribonucleoside-triphosphate reductase activating protein